MAQLTKDIRWGIVGSGAIAAQFADGLRYTRGGRLHGVTSRTPARAERLARAFGARLFPTADALARDPEIDVVYVATPNEHHRTHALAAIDAGKAVLCEKPFALTAAEGREVLHAASARGVFCMEGMWMRCSTAFREAVELAKGGAIGDLRLLTAALGFANVPGAGRLFAPAGGGALLDLGVYVVSLAQAVFGTPARVSAAAVIEPNGVDEQVSVLLEFAGGRQAVLTASIRSVLTNTATIYGLGGRIDFDEPLYFPRGYRVATFTPSAPSSPDAPIAGAARSRPALQPAIDIVRGVVRAMRSRHVVRRPAGTGLTMEAEEVMRCLRGGLTESPLMTQADTLAVLDTMDAIRRAWHPN